MNILIKYEGEFYLASVSEAPKLGDVVLLRDGSINTATNEHIKDGLKVIKSTLNGDLNPQEIERLLVLRPEQETSWLVGYTKQNYLMLL